MKPTRREVTAVGIGTMLGISGLTLTSQRGSAAEIDGEFTIPEVSEQIVNPINSLRLSVEGTMSWESDSTPTRAVLRLEVARSGAFEQMEAEAYSNGLERTHEQSFSFEDTNLLEHSRISAAGVSPTSTGETTNLTITARLTLEVMKDGQELETATLEETVPLEFTKTNGQTDVSMGATGTIEIDTSD